MTSTVPTKDQVLIPESLLKKRKTQEKTQAEREQARCREKEGILKNGIPRRICYVDDSDKCRERDESLRDDEVFLYHLSGLSRATFLFLF